MVRGALNGYAARLQFLLGLAEFVQRVADLDADVIKADSGTFEGSRRVAHLDEQEFVVRAPTRERGRLASKNLSHHLEPEKIPVEPQGPLQVAHVEHDVAEVRRFYEHSPALPQRIPVLGPSQRPGAFRKPNNRPEGCLARMVDAQNVLLSLGAIILIGLLGALLFNRTKISDVLALLAAGILFGPILGLLDVATFITLMPILGTLAIIVIVFDAGLSLKLEHLAEEGTRGITLSFLAFLLSVVATVLVSYQYVDWSLGTRILLGVVVGSTGTAIVLALLKGMGVSHHVRTLTILETSLNDLYVVLGVIVVAPLLLSATPNIGNLVLYVGRLFLVGIILGAVVGVLLVQILGRLPRHPSHYLFTFATLLLLYFVVERLGGAGILAVLMVGIAVTNAEVGTPARPSRPRGNNWSWAPLFHRDLQVLQGEAFFFLRSFFFVALGATLDLNLLTPEFFGLSALLTVGLFLARYAAVSLSTVGTRMPPRDVLAITILGPRGLSTAALASIPFLQFGLVDTRDFPGYATAVVLFTNVVTTIAVWLRERSLKPPGRTPDASIAARTKK